MRAEICISTGLDPIAQPPGKETSASPNLAKSGPKTKNFNSIFHKGDFCHARK